MVTFMVAFFFLKKPGMKSVLFLYTGKKKGKKNKQNRTPQNKQTNK